MVGRGDGLGPGLGPELHAPAPPPHRPFIYMLVPRKGLPVGLWIINRLPSIITLRPQETSLYVNARGQVTGIPQRSFLGRAIWFLLIGWWLSGVWMALAYVCLLTILLIPISFWMYGRVGAVTTLYRS